MDKNTKDNTPVSNEIKFKIFISTGGEYEITANSKEIFSSVLEKFNKTHNIKDFDKINTGLCSGEIIKFNKNLEDNNIKDNSCIILYTLNKDFTPNPDNNDINNKKEEKKPTEDLLIEEDLLEDLIMNEVVNFQNVLLDNINLNNTKDNDINNKNDKENENKDIQLKKPNHEHNLVFLFSNCDWTCVKCGKYFNDKKAKYYCSLCNYNLCEECFTDKKLYPLKEFYHEQTKLRIYSMPIHDHKLIYCRTSRFDDKLSQWICDICNKYYNYKIWSFYCTKCDYDICLKCAKEYIPKEDLISNIGIKTEMHEHSLIYLMTDLDWLCLICLKSFDKGIFPCYCCTFCDFFVCQDCIESISDEEKYLFYKEGKKENISEMKINNKCHEHPLIYCMASKYREKEKWKCNICNEKYEFENWMFYCSLCDLSICYLCYTNTK